MCTGITASLRWKMFPIKYLIIILWALHTIAYTASEEAPEPVNLTADQQHDLEKLKEEFSDVISDVPGRTTVVEHHIATGDATPI